MNPGIYLLADPEVLPPLEWPRVLPPVLKSGIVLLQLRVKSQDARYRLRLAEQCRALSAAAKVRFVVNDDIALAQACSADGVHLGQSDGAVSAAREQLGPGAIIGRTCHGQLALVDAANAEGADYASVGALFSSRTKPLAPPASLPLLQSAVKSSAIPICAIGGIHENNIVSVVQSGAKLVAVCGSVLRAADPAEASRRLVRLFADEYQHQSV